MILTIKTPPETGGGKQKEYKQQLSSDLAEQSYRQFLLLKERFNLSDEEYNAFSLGYVIGIFSTLKSTKEIYR